MECVKGAVCCSPAVYQFFRVTKTELTLWGCSIFVQRIFVGVTSFMAWMTTSLESHNRCFSFPFTLKPFLHVHFFYFKSLLLTLEVNLTFSLAIPFPVVPSLPSPVADHPSFHTAIPPGSLFQHIKWNLTQWEGFSPSWAEKETFWEEVEAQVNTLARRRMIFLRKNQKCRALILNSFLFVSPDKVAPSFGNRIFWRSQSSTVWQLWKKTDLNKCFCPSCQEVLSGVVVITSKDTVQHQGISLTMEGSVNLQLSAKNVGVFEAFCSTAKVRPAQGNVFSTKTSLFSDETFP